MMGYSRHSSPSRKICVAGLVLAKDDHETFCICGEIAKYVQGVVV